jgi:hypothetical protein
MAGLEPARGFDPQQILSLSWLPLHHIGISYYTLNQITDTIYERFKRESRYKILPCVSVPLARIELATLASSGRRSTNELKWQINQIIVSNHCSTIYKQKLARAR